MFESVEVGSPNATYELTIKTAMPRGATIPKGRVSLPREPKPKAKDKILVFADGKAAEAAKKAGADIVGGAELAEAVRIKPDPEDVRLMCSRWQAAGFKQLCSSQPHL